MISDNAFAREIRELTDTAFAVAYLILGNSADCEDAMSEAILRAYKNRERLKKRDSFRAWFLQILRHEAYNVLRKQRKVFPVEEIPEREAPNQDADRQIDLHAAMEQLDEDQRTALLLQQEGYSLAEIGQALGIPVGTVKSRISRSKQKLRSILEEE